MQSIFKHIGAMSAVCLIFSQAEQLPLWGEQAVIVALAGLIINLCLFATAVRTLARAQA